MTQENDDRYGELQDLFSDEEEKLTLAFHERLRNSPEYRKIASELIQLGHLVSTTNDPKVFDEFQKKFDILVELEDSLAGNPHHSDSDIDKTQLPPQQAVNPEKGFALHKRKDEKPWQHGKHPSQKKK